MSGGVAGGQPLAIEMAVYDRALPSLLSDEGKFVLIVGEKIIDIFLAYEDALKAGYKEAGLNPFLVKKISGNESAMYFTRDIASQCLTTHSQ